MIEIQAFADRLQAYIDYKNITIWDFEQRCTLKKGVINNAIKNKGAIGSDKLALIIANNRDLNVVWLLLGIGEMTIKDDSKEVYEVNEDTPIYHTKYNGAAIAPPQENIIDMKNTIIENQAARISLLEELLDICKGNKK